MIADLVVLGLAIALEPFPLTADILLLGADRGVAKGIGFLSGWLACLVVVVAAVLAGTGGAPPRAHTAPSTTLVVIKLLLGVVLLGLAYRQYRRFGRPHQPPRWMGRIDRISPLASAGLAAFLQPWALVAAGAATVAEADLSNSLTYLTLVGFCLLGSSSFLLLQLYSVVAPQRASARLARLRNLMDAHRDQAIVVIALAAGAWLVVKGIVQLA